MKLFISYSHVDEPALNNLYKHLAMLRRDGLIDQWHDRRILAGDSIDREIDENLGDSDIYLALVSPDFLNSDYCMEREMAKAMEMHEEGAIRIIPIIIEPCDWKTSKLRHFRVLPKDGKPVSGWPNVNNAYLDVVVELRRIIESQLTGQDSAGEKSETNSGHSKNRTYRVKKEFDKIDRDDFRARAFEEMRDYFEQSVEEIDHVDGVRARFRNQGPERFSCTLVNESMKRSGESHISVMAGGSTFSIGDISYSFQENAREGSANGWFSIEATEYDLQLCWNSFGNSEDDSAMSPRRAASVLWREFIENAGISYD